MRSALIGLLVAMSLFGDTIGTLTVNTHPVTQSSGPWTVNVTQYGGSNIVTGTGAGGAGIPRVTVSNDSTVGLVAGSALIGEVASVTTATTTDTASTYALQSAASTNSTSVKGSAGNVYSISAINTATTIYYLRLYNASSAPTCSSATGFVETLPVPPGAATGQAAGLVRSVTNGQAFSTGIGFCLTGGGSSTDNTSAATGVYVSLLYK
jgi:hypothetical protein